MHAVASHAPRPVRHSSADLVSLFPPQLLDRDPVSRLGGGPRDAEEVKEHEFFAGVNWDDILNRRVPPPYVPVLIGPHDVSNFDDEFTREIPSVSPVDGVSLHRTIDFCLWWGVSESSLTVLAVPSHASVGTVPHSCPVNRSWFKLMSETALVSLTGPASSLRLRSMHTPIRPLVSIIGSPLSADEQAEFSGFSYKASWLDVGGL